MDIEKNEPSKEFLYNAKDKIKALQDLDRHSSNEVASWTLTALDFSYPYEYKKAFEIVTKRKWDDIRAEIMQAVKSQNYQQISTITEGMLNARLLSPEIIREFGKDLGNLAVFYDRNPNKQLIIALILVNNEAKDPKLQTYILYRYLCGKPMLSNGFLNKF
jgi:hypothetical protein